MRRKIPRSGGKSVHLRFACLWLLIGGISGAADARFTPDAPQSPLVHVEPGASTAFSFRVSNTGTTTSGNVSGFLFSDSLGLPGYEFIPLNPQCGPPTAQPPRIVFPLPGPIATGETITCSYRIERAIDALDDLHFRLCGSHEQGCHKEYAIGSLPQMRLHVEQVHPVAVGARSALVRLRVDNLSQWTVPQRDVATSCHEYTGGMGSSWPFEIRNDFEGACVSGPSDSCLNFMGFNDFSYRFALGPFLPGESRSCLLRLEFPVPVERSANAAVYFRDHRVIRDDGAIGIGGLGYYTGWQVLGAEVKPAAIPAPVQVPLDRSTLLALVLLLLGCAALAFARAGNAT